MKRLLLILVLLVLLAELRINKKRKHRRNRRKHKRGGDDHKDEDRKHMTLFGCNVYEVDKDAVKLFKEAADKFGADWGISSVYI